MISNNPFKANKISNFIQKVFNTIFYETDYKGDVLNKDLGNFKISEETEYHKNLKKHFGNIGESNS